MKKVISIYFLVHKKKLFFFKSSSQPVLCMWNGVRGKEQKKFWKIFIFQAPPAKKLKNSPKMGYFPHFLPFLIFLAIIVVWYMKLYVLGVEEFIFDTYYSFYYISDLLSAKNGQKMAKLAYFFSFSNFCRCFFL